MSNVEYSIGSNTDDGDEEGMIPLSKALKSLRDLQRKFHLNFIETPSWPTLEQDEVFLYPYNRHCYAGLFVKNLELVLIGDGANSLKGNPTLRRELAKNLVPGGTMMRVVNVLNALRKNHCGTDAVASAIALMQKFSNNDFSERILISAYSRKKARKA